MPVKSLIKDALARLGLLDYCIFVLNDQIKDFSRARLSRNWQYRVRGAADDLPIPHGYLIWLVIGSSDVRVFLESGAVHAHQVIRYVLEQSDLELDGFDAILDFGCGCGRIMRYWKDFKHPQLYGSDYNPALVRWCGRHLPSSRPTNLFHPWISRLNNLILFARAWSLPTWTESFNSPE